MRVCKVPAILFSFIMLASALTFIPTDVAYGDTEDDTEPFYDGMAAQVLDGITAVSESISECSDELPLPPGTISILAGVTDDDTSEPQTEPVTGHVVYDHSVVIPQLYVVGGADIELANDVTLTVNEMFIESSEIPIGLSTGNHGRMVVKSLVIDGLILPLPEISVEATQATIESEYWQNGEDRHFMVKISYIDVLNISIEDVTVTYSSDDLTDILISVDVDLTDYIDRISTPEPLSTLDRLLRYISSLDLVKMDLKVEVGGEYDINGYETDFNASNLRLSIDSHKDSETPYYNIDLGLGKVSAYPVNIEGMSIHADLPASRMKDGSRPIMDKSREFEIDVGAIEANGSETYEPITVAVEGLKIELRTNPEKYVSLSMKNMAYHEFVDDDTVDVGTNVNEISLKFNGTSSELLDDPTGLAKDILSTGKGVSGTISLNSISYSRFNNIGQILVEKATINGLELKALLVIPQFMMHFDLDSFDYADAKKELSCDSIGYDMWLGLITPIDPDSVKSILDLLKLMEMKSIAVVTAEGGPDYHFTIDSGRAFMASLSTEGLRAICGNDSIVLDKRSVSGLYISGDIDIHYRILSNNDVDNEVPGKISERLNGGIVVEMSDSSSIMDLSGIITLTVNNDVNQSDVGVYYLNTEEKTLEEIEFIYGEGSVTFKTDKMGMYAVTGPLLEPDKTIAAVGCFAAAVILGIITVAIYRWHNTRNKSDVPEED